MRVVVEKVHKVKARVTSAGEPQLYSVAMPEAAAQQIVDALPGVAEAYETWRFVLYATNTMPVLFSRDFASLGACSAWAKLLANGVGADLELPCAS